VAGIIGLRRGHWLAVGVFVVYLVLTSCSVLSEYIWDSEAWFASPAFTLLHKGYLGTTILESKGTWMAGLDRHTYWIPPIYPLAEAAWFRLFGFGLVAMRYLSVAAGGVVLFAWYAIVARLAGSRGIALLSIALTAIEPRFIVFSTVGRPDTLCAALGALGWAVYLIVRERSLARAILAGSALTAASCLTHPCGELYAAGLLVLVLYLDWRRMSWRGWGIFAVPWAAAIAAWGVYIVQAPAAFMSQFFGNIGGVGTEFTGINRLAGLGAPLSALKREYFLRYGFTFGWQSTIPAERIQLFALLVYTMGIAGCLLTPAIRNNRGCRALLLVGSLTYATMAIVDGFKSSGYLVHTMPMACALLAIFVRYCFTLRPALRGATAAVLAAFVAVQSFALQRNFTVTPLRWDYENALRFLRRSRAAPAQVIAAGEFAFALGFDSGTVDDIRLGYFSGRRAQWIAANDIYAGWLRQSATLNPVIHDYMARLLRDEYRVAFRNSGYTVYRLNAGSAARP